MMERSGEVRADQKRFELGVAAHEAAVEFVRGSGVARAQDVVAERAAGVRIRIPSLRKRLNASASSTSDHL